MSTNDPDPDPDDTTEGREGATSSVADGDDTDGPATTAGADDVEPPVTSDEADAPVAARSGDPGRDRRTGADREGTPNTVLNAVIGGVVTAVTTAFVGPFSPVIGGGVAGYLEGGETSDGTKVGAFAGLVALVPLLLFLPFLLFVVPFVGPRGGIAFLLLMVFGLSMLGAYVVGVSAVGGVLGAYLKRER